jgi:hypothetical protein
MGGGGKLPHPAIVKNPFPKRKRVLAKGGKGDNMDLKVAVVTLWADDFEGTV